MFQSDWTPDHLQSGPTNLYEKIAIALKGVEWREPGLVELAKMIAEKKQTAASRGSHKAGRPAVSKGAARLSRPAESPKHASDSDPSTEADVSAAATAQRSLDA